MLGWRGIANECLSRFAWTQENGTIEVNDDGLRIANPWGSSFVSWTSGVVVQSLSTCFVLEVEGDDLTIVPKRYLNSTELLILQNRAAGAELSQHE